MSPRVKILAGPLVVALLVLTASDRGFAQPVFDDDRQLPGFGQMEAARLKAEEDERQRLAAEAEQKRKTEEAQRQKAEEDERQRLATEAEQKRKTEEAARLKAEEDERQRLATEAEQKRKTEEAARLKAEEDERQRLAAEAEQKRKTEEAARLKAEEDERQRLAAEAEQKRKTQEAARLKAEEDERQRLAATADTDAKRREAEAQQLAEEDARRLAAAEVQRRLALEAQQKSDGEPKTAPRSSQQQAAIGTPAPVAAVPTGQGRCPATGSFTLTTKPLPAGRLKLDIASRCRAGETVSIRYGSHVFSRKLDLDGKLDGLLDLFLGTSARASVVFADNVSAPLALPAADLTGITKVALIWNAPVDLDLHAFEYVATRGGKGHVWSIAPGSAEAIVAEVGNGAKRGRGFISSASEGDALGESLEVYTFIHIPEQASGVIRLEVDYKTRGSTPSGETCGTGKYAELDYTVVRMLEGGEAKSERLQFSSVPCGVALDAIQRHLAYTIGDLRIRR